MTIIEMNCADVRFVKELYPRLKPIDEVIERYRDSLENLPPIIIARDGVLVDGYHRWQGHVRENVETIRAENLGNLSDAEIVRESIQRNAAHGQQLSREDKKRLAQQLWLSMAHIANGERKTDISALLAVSEDSVENWTKEARAVEREMLRRATIDAWLNCSGSNREIGDRFKIDDKTVAKWTAEFTEQSADSAPDSRQHFDIWQFPISDKDSGQQSYFGAIPPQVVENLLWFYTEPGEIVVDPFAGSGTTIDVAKAMGRRIWASDIRGNHYSPHLPIHKYDILAEWPPAAPRKADLVFLDPPYWQQAKGRYSSELNEMAEMNIDDFMTAWNQVVKTCIQRARRIAYVISPTQNEDGSVIDHAIEFLAPFAKAKWKTERRIIVPYSTQQSNGQQVTWARENKRMLKLYRDLLVMAPA